MLFREDKSCFYIYQLIVNGRSQTGLVGVSSIDDYEKGIIKKHEFTRPEKNRTALIILKQLMHKPAMNVSRIQECE